MEPKWKAKEELAANAHQLNAASVIGDIYYCKKDAKIRAFTDPCSPV